jgi:hypothetical protein
MSEMDGFEFMQYLTRNDYTCGLIFISGEGDYMLEAAYDLAVKKNINILGAITNPIEADVIEKLLKEFFLTNITLDCQSSVNSRIYISGHSMLHIKSYDRHEKRRKYPGVIIQQPVEIKHKTKILKATVYDISPDGLQIRCNRETMYAIHPGGEFIRKNNAPLIDVVFSLPIGKSHRQIKATCIIYYFVLRSV